MCSVIVLLVEMPVATVSQLNPDVAVQLAVRLTNEDMAASSAGDVAACLG